MLGMANSRRTGVTQTMSAAGGAPRSRVRAGSRRPCSGASARRDGGGQRFGPPRKRECCASWRQECCPRRRHRRQFGERNALFPSARVGRRFAGAGLLTRHRECAGRNRGLRRRAGPGRGIGERRPSGPSRRGRAAQIQAWWKAHVTPFAGATLAGVEEGGLAGLRESSEESALQCQPAQRPQISGVIVERLAPAGCT
jgi:hypothetical protein